MTKPELGTKRVCAGCNAKFYDLHKTPIVCPACEAVFVLPKPAPVRPPRRPYGSMSPVAPVVVAPVTAAATAAAAAAAAADDADGDKDDKDSASGVPLLEEMDED